MPDMTSDDILLAEFVKKTQSEKGLAEVRAAANGKGRRATIARAALRQRGGKEGQANFPSGSMEMSRGGAVKAKYNKGGYANCGASMKPSQKMTMMYGGMARKKK